MSEEILDDSSCRENSASLQFKVEALIIELREGQQEKKLSWNQITSIVNKTFGEKKRTLSQCRRRYLKHLESQNNGIDNKRWGFKEIEAICELYLKYGPDWRLIHQSHPVRTPEIIKNHIKHAFESLLISINKKIKIKLYQIKFNSFKRFLVITDPQYNLEIEEHELSKFQKIREIIVKCALFAAYGEISLEEHHQEIVDGLHDFNRQFRHLNMRSYSYIRNSLANQAIKSSKSKKGSKAEKNSSPEIVVRIKLEEEEEEQGKDDQMENDMNIEKESPAKGNERETGEEGAQKYAQNKNQNESNQKLSYHPQPHYFPPFPAYPYSLHWPPQFFYPSPFHQTPPNFQFPSNLPYR